MAKKERALTPAEQKRTAYFLGKSQELERQGYRRRDLTIGVVKANVLAVAVMLPPAALFLAVYLASGARPSALQPRPSDAQLLFWYAAAFAALLLLAVLHEGIHAVTWALFAEHRLHSIEFGVIWKYLTPYCTCRDALTRPQYLLGSAMPTVLLGFLPAALGAALGNFPLLAAGIVMLFGGGGDALIILKLLRYRAESEQVLCLDHPSELGVVVFERVK